MDIEFKRVDPQIEVRVVVPTGMVDLAMLTVTRNLAGRVTIPGFRRGKAPLSLVRHHLSEERVQEDALDLLLDQVLQEVYTREEIAPLFPPQVEAGKLQEGQPLEVKLTIDPWPHPELPGVEGLKLHLPDPRVSEADVEESLLKLRRTFAQYSSKEGPAQIGDSVAFKWKLGENESWRNELIDLGQESLLPGFDKQLVGLQAGEEKEFELTVREKMVHIWAQVVEVKEKHLPAEGDDFAKSVGLENMDMLRANIEGDLRQGRVGAYEEKLREELLHHYLELIPLQFSTYVGDKVLANYRKSTEESLERRGRTFSEYLEQIGMGEDQWEETVGRQMSLELLKEQIVLSELAKKFDIQVSDEEKATEQQRKPDFDPEMAQGALRRRKALDHLVEEWRFFVATRVEPEEDTE